MDEKTLIEKLADECEIYYGSDLISGEEILKKYLDFFTTQFDKNEKKVSFSLHTGSRCFDIVAIVAIALGCITYNMTSNEDIIDAFEIGDMVIYKASRYRWMGIEKKDEKKYFVLEQDGKGRNGKGRNFIPYDNYKHLVKPYYGNSKITDSRGIPKKQHDREAFLSWLMNVPIQEIPSEFDVSVVIVTNRKQFTEIAQHVRLVYDKVKEIGLLDIVPAAYYTLNGEEHLIGKNPTKSEAILKVTTKISEARSLVFDKKGNKVIGLLTIGTGAMVKDGSELSDLMRRKSLKFVHVMDSLHSEVSEDILDLYEEADLFACTKEYLEQNSSPVQNENSLTNELNMQVRNIIKSDIHSIRIDEKEWSWEQYKALKDEIFKVRQSDWEDKDEFVLSSDALLNLFNTAVFSLKSMESALTEKKINTAVISPKMRLKRLKELTDYAGDLQEVCSLITQTLEQKYEKIYYDNKKKLKLEEYIRSKSGKEIAVIVPKAYYVELLNEIYSKSYLWNKVTFVTVNRYDSRRNYDDVLIVGNLSNKKFDPLRYNATDSIDILLYPCEEILFNYTKKKSAILTKKLNKRLGLMQDESNYEKKEIEDAWDEHATQEILDLNKYIESMNLYSLRQFVTSSDGKSMGLISAEVQIVGTFITGERIFFSKNYSPIRYNSDTGSVMETTTDKLDTGDVLIFVKRDAYTKNVVDLIYEQLIKENKLNAEVVKATEMSKYWKEALQNYKESGNFTYQNLATQLKKYGCTLGAVTIRQWLVNDSHIIGPQDEKTMQQIAFLTQDKDLMEDAHGFFDACRIVRHQRKEILDMIGRAINERLAGKRKKEDGILSIVYDNIDNLSEILELDNVAKLEKAINIPVNLVNRPIIETEELL